MSKQETYQALDGLLTQEHDCAKSLLNILTKERATLAKNPDELTTRITTKKIMIDELDQLNKLRNSVLETANFESQQVTKCINWCASNDALSNDKLMEKWDSLMTTIDKCRQYNQTNGTIIESSSQRIRQTLAILHGQNPEKLTYSPNGKAIDSGAHRTIAKA